ncbi:hypothetical protein THIOM_004515 [Candidatus Thiomargarita nelsonii]|uniref:Uncharacterized protein n=1 Tax=Candidatus Thiomargarita nelsonii TaxID=1003181 RepID=A0A176RVS5_9GAMM|nr:hypothetical protein THIOM_004515 [Candidatus Thiomargarita nelsonii]
MRTKLPDFEPSLVAQFERDTTQWLSTVNTVLAGLYAAKKDEQVLHSMQLIGTFLQPSQPKQVSHDEPPSHKTPVQTTKRKKRNKPAPQPSPSQVGHLWEQLTPNKVDLPTDPKEQEIELSRWYSWKIAHAANVSEMQSYIERWQAWKKPPASGDDDIVVYVENPALSGSPPVWIGQVDLFSLFVQGGMSPSAQVWLSFAQTANQVETEQYLWSQKHPDTVPLLHRWHDLNCWAVLAPEAQVFVTGKHELLSQQRDVIWKKMLQIERNLTANLKEEDKFVHIARSLQELYAVFHQFLLPQDLSPDGRSFEVFSSLRQAASDNVKIWRKYLEVEELHSAGCPKEIEYIASVSKQTEGNIRISTKSPLSVEFEEEKVLYWLRPRWRLQNQRKTEMKGRVLYCF